MVHYSTNPTLPIFLKHPRPRRYVTPFGWLASRCRKTPMGFSPCLVREGPLRYAPSHSRPASRGLSLWACPPTRRAYFGIRSLDSRTLRLFKGDKVSRLLSDKGVICSLARVAALQYRIHLKLVPLFPSIMPHRFSVPTVRRTGMTRENLSAVADAVSIATGLVLLFEALTKLL